MVKRTLFSRVADRLAIFVTVAASLGVLFTACKDTVVDPEGSGKIEGVIRQFGTNEPIEGALVTTKPATNGVSTNEDGEFAIEPVAPDTYRVQAKKPGYLTNSVGVSVQEGHTVRSTVLLEKEEADSTEVSIAPAITTWRKREPKDDSAFVNVEYEVRNTGNATVTSYEVYFRIGTDGGDYKSEVGGNDLKTGQADMGSFEKYIANNSVSQVEITDHWVTDEESDQNGGFGKTGNHQAGSVDGHD